MSSNPFMSPENFNPRIAKEVRTAYKSNFDRSPTSNITDVEVTGVRGLGDAVKSAITESKRTLGSTIAGFEQIDNLETMEAFQARFAIAEKLYERINVTIPTVNQCTNAGIDLGLFSNTYEHMKARGLEPQIVLAPNLCLEDWDKLYNSLRDDVVANSRGYLAKDPLSIALSTARVWAKLSELPSSIPVIASFDTAVVWSLRIIPGTPMAPVLDVDHSCNEGTHPTVTEYLSLQAMRVEAQEVPLDGGMRANTWLNQEYRDQYDVLYAPHGFWNSEDCSVGIGAISPDPAFTAPGARLPVWG